MAICCGVSSRGRCALRRTAGRRDDRLRRQPPHRPAADTHTRPRARFRRAGFRRARFRRARLQGARPRGARLRGARPRGARLRGAQLRQRRKAPAQAGTRPYRRGPHEGSDPGRCGRRSDRSRRRHHADRAPPQQPVTPFPAHPSPLERPGRTPSARRTRRRVLSVAHHPPGRLPAAAGQAVGRPPPSPHHGRTAGPRGPAVRPWSDHVLPRPAAGRLAEGDPPAATRALAVTGPEDSVTGTASRQGRPAPAARRRRAAARPAVRFRPLGLILRGAPDRLLHGPLQLVPVLPGYPTAAEPGATLQVRWSPSTLLALTRELVRTMRDAIPRPRARRPGLPGETGPGEPKTAAALCDQRARVADRKSIGSGVGRDRRAPGEKTITLREGCAGRKGAQTPKTDGPTPPQIMLMHLDSCCKSFAIKA
ncbi:pentapeptide repeat-containing protein [Streptomyces sp. NPDC015220]|uniref:pentapeptide repeat-containing protein n=1 Tax=Streptomyces sp. NPDC015220 TaxID=3364947 RepID=UPI0036FD1BD8